MQQTVYIILCLLCGQLYSQVNTEALRKGDLDNGAYYTVSTSFSYSSGNSDYLKLNTGARIDFLNNSFYSFLIGNYQRGIAGTDNEVFINKGFMHLRMMQLLLRNLSGEVFGQKEFNDFINLNDRNLLGAGLRINFVRETENDSAKSKSDISATIGLGLMWEYENYSNPARTTRLIRSTNYFSVGWQFDSRANLKIINYFQPALENFSDYRILSEGRLSFKLAKSVTFRTVLNFRYDNDPQEGIEKHDLDILNGISVTF